MGRCCFYIQHSEKKNIEKEGFYSAKALECHNNCLSVWGGHLISLHVTLQ